MVFYGIISVGVGAMLGAWLRWALSMLLNPILPMLPLGTLTANLLGGYLIGLVLGYIEHFQTLSPEMRLFRHHRISRRPDDVLDVLRRNYGAAVAPGISVGGSDDRRAHVLGSIAMTLLGVGTLALSKGVVRAVRCSITLHGPWLSVARTSPSMSRPTNHWPPNVPRAHAASESRRCSIRNSFDRTRKRYVWRLRGAVTDSTCSSFSSSNRGARRCSSKPNSLQNERNTKSKSIGQAKACRARHSAVAG